MANPPLTDEQIEFFADQNRIAAERASKRTIRRALVGYLVLGIGVLVMYWNGQHVSDGERNAIVESGTAVTVDSCNRDFRSTQRLRSLLEHAQDSVTLSFKQNKISAEQYADAKAFYVKELALIPLPDCRQAVAAITDDPDAPIQKPVPLHPRDTAPSASLGGFPR